MWSTAVYGVTSACFAFSHQYLIASALLVIGGVANLAALSITQTVVQLRAPRDKRGQVIGVFGMSANGLRLGSGFTVGILGTVLGAARLARPERGDHVRGHRYGRGRYLALGPRKPAGADAGLAAAQAEAAPGPALPGDSRWSAASPRCRKTGEEPGGRRTGI